MRRGRRGRRATATPWDYSKYFLRARCSSGARESRQTRSPPLPSAAAPPAAAFEADSSALCLLSWSCRRSPGVERERSSVSRPVSSPTSRGSLPLRRTFGSCPGPRSIPPEPLPSPFSSPSPSPFPPCQSLHFSSESMSFSMPSFICFICSGVSFPRSLGSSLDNWSRSSGFGFMAPV